MLVCDKSGDDLDNANEDVIVKRIIRNRRNMAVMTKLGMTTTLMTTMMIAV